MADLSDVLNALVAQIALVLYPSGSSGEQVSPVAGVPVRIEPGWPLPQSLNDALTAGKSHVSVFPPSGMERNTTRFPTEWQDFSINAATYTLVAAGQTITVGGAAPATYYPQNLAVTVNGVPYLVQTTTGQTPSSVAAALQALIVAAVVGTTVVGAVITLPATARIGFLRVGATGISIKEVRRQERGIQIIVWSPTPANRDAVAQPIDLALAQTKFLTLADGMAARLIYKSTLLIDTDQKALLYRRDFFYTVEYATTITEADTAIVSEQTAVTPQIDGTSSSSGSPTRTFYE